MLPVDLAAMPDSDDEDEQDPVVDLINDAVITGAYPPFTATASEVGGSRGPWLLAEQVDGRLHP